MHPCGSIHTEDENLTDNKMRTVILWFLNWLILWDTVLMTFLKWHFVMRHGSRWKSELNAIRHQSFLLPKRPRCWGEITVCQTMLLLTAGEPAHTSARCVDKKQTHGKLAPESKQSLALFWCQNKHFFLLFLDDNIYKHTNSNSRIKWFLSS